MKEIKSRIVKVTLNLEPYFELNGLNPVEAEIIINVKSEQELLEIVSEFYKLYISKLTKQK